jgi:hypothetical protein
MNTRTRIHVEVLLLGVLALLLVSAARSDTTSSFTPGEGVNLVLNSTGKILQRGLKDDEACRKAAEAEASRLQQSLVFRCDPAYGVVAVNFTPGPVRVALPPSAPFTDAQKLLRVRAATGQAPVSSDVGAFRVPCQYSHTLEDDPIVFPGKPGASHAHTFWGNTSTNGNSTTDLLLAAARGTCAGGIANLTAYWTPAVVYDNRALVPTGIQVYYKTGYNKLLATEIKTPPNGLRIVAGRSATTTTLPKYEEGARFACGRDPWQITIPACPAGSELHLNLMFPNCWDGKNLDSPDHRSHMASTQSFRDRRCPATHPVPIPTIELNLTYVVEAGANASRYRLSSDKYSTDEPGGYSFHGDVWLAWDEDIKATWMKNCINASKDCHSYLLGDGRALY